MREKSRLDLLLIRLSLATTRTKAQELIASGKVKVNGALVHKPGERVGDGACIELLAEEHPYASRGGSKLEAALRSFSMDVTDRIVLDVGISTGGFTHCLLLHGAKSVVGIDVGHDQLAQALREDPRVRLIERQDIRSLSPELFPDRFDRFTVDLSFISLRLVLRELSRLLQAGAEGVVLVKPQFELGPEKISSGGIVRSAALREEALMGVKTAAEKCGYRVCGAIPSPIFGGDGNQEFLLHLAWPSSAPAF